MAQRVHPISFRLGVNRFWPSIWYSKNNYSALLHEDLLLEKYFRSLFEVRGVFFKQLLIRRSSNATFLFVQIYSNPNFKYIIPKHLRKRRKIYALQFTLENIKKFLIRLSTAKIYLSIINLYGLNVAHNPGPKILKQEFRSFRRHRFALNLLTFFGILLKIQSASLFAKAISREIEFLEKRRKNKTTKAILSFLGRFIYRLEMSNELKGLKLQLVGRLQGRKRPKRYRYRFGNVPTNTLSANLDYSATTAITVNGSVGIKLWICYKNINFI